MSRTRRGPVLALLTGGVAAGTVVAGILVAAALPATASPVSGASAARGAAGAGRATAASTGICTSAKHPKLAARISKGVKAALAGRTDSTVGLTVNDPAYGLTCSFHSRWHFISASVIKATIISALLLKEGGPAGMTRAQHDLAWQMITESNDDAATDLWNEVGMAGMQRFLDKAGMSHTELNTAWGLTKLTAQDEMKLLHVLTTKGKILSNGSRSYALWLMSKVTPSQRWGVPAGAPSEVTVHVKNGWLPYPDTNLSSDDWHINSIGAFTGHDIAYQIVVLTEPRSTSDPAQSEGYGIDTIQAAAEVINKDLAKA